MALWKNWRDSSGSESTGTAWPRSRGGHTGRRLSSGTQGWLRHWGASSSLFRPLPPRHPPWEATRGAGSRQDRMWVLRAGNSPGNIGRWNEGRNERYSRKCTILYVFRRKSSLSFILNFTVGAWRPFFWMRDLSTVHWTTGFISCHSHNIHQEPYGHSFNFNFYYNV